MSNIHHAFPSETSIAPTAGASLESTRPPSVGLQLVYRRVEDLIPYANNPRKNDHAIEPMCASIREFGFKIPILATSSAMSSMVISDSRRPDA